MCIERNDLLPKNLSHCFSLYEFINQLVYIAYVSHKRIFDVFHTNPTHDTFDERTLWMNGWGLSKKGFKIVFLFYLLL